MEDNYVYVHNNFIFLLFSVGTIQAQENFMNSLVSAFQCQWMRLQYTTISGWWQKTKGIYLDVVSYKFRFL